MAVSNSVLMLRTFCYVDSNNGYETFELECLSVVFVVYQSKPYA